MYELPENRDYYYRLGLLEAELTSERAKNAQLQEEVGLWQGRTKEMVTSLIVALLLLIVVAIVLMAAGIYIML